MIDPAWKDIIIHRSAPAFKPRKHTGSGILQELELNGAVCLLLCHNCARSDLTAVDDVTDLLSNKVAATQLAFDGDVKQSAVA